MEVALIVGLEEGELLGLGQGGQDAGDVAADDAALAVDGLGRLGPAPLGGGQDRQVVQAGGHVGVVAPQLLLPDLQAAAVERLGLGVPAHGLVQDARLFRLVATSGWSRPSCFSQISRLRRKSGSASAYRPMAMYRTARLFRLVATSGWSAPELLLPDLQAAAVERLGLGVPAHGLVQDRQVVQAGGHVGVVAPELLLPDLQAAAVERLGLGVPAHGLVQAARLFRLVATSGWSRPSCFSQISRLRRKSGSASAYRPMAWYRSARLFRLVATSGWSGPSCFS